MRLTDAERLELARGAVAEALAAMRSDRRPEANRVLIHAVHEGVAPFELVAEIAAQTGGTL